MVHEEEVVQLIDKFTGSGRTFAEFLGDLFKGKFIEIYVGDSYEEISTEQVSTAYPAVFCGKVIGAYRECLIINGVYADQNKEFVLGNIMFINERAIRALNEADGNGILEDMFLRSREAGEVASFFRRKGE